MARQLITVRPDGSLFGLQHKKGKGVDLTKLGRASVKRVTMIEWDEDVQQWYIRWIDSDDPWTVRFMLDSLLPDKDKQNPLAGNWTAYFEDYDLAVKAEVDVVQSLTKKGAVSNGELTAPKQETH